MEIMVESLPILGICNLCLNQDAVKNMLIAHMYDGIDEKYDSMLLNCFSIDITALELGDAKRLICDACIKKLRDAILFKYQVESSLKTLEANIKLEKENEEHIKEELSENKLLDDCYFDEDLAKDDDDIANDDDDIDDYTFPKDISAKKQDSSLEVRKVQKTRLNDTPRPKKKLLKYSVKKLNDLVETDGMLEAGLFPFKLRQDKSFSCVICPEKSTNLDEIKTHVCGHSKKNINYAFQKMMFSRSHRFFKTSSKLRCKMCTSDISNYEELKQHIENCTRLMYKNHKWNNLPFKLEKDQLDCPICKKTFLNFVNLNTHMNVHYPNYICENCGKAFASTARLRGHIRTHEIGEFPCRYCNAVFDRVTKRENHISKEHKSGVRYACKRCNISLSSFYARQKHLAEVHNEELKRYKCKACPQSYITPGHLSSHVRRDHLNERNHKCDQCDQAFYTRNALKMHMIKHDGKRIHTCNICQKSYQRKKTLKEHMRIHNNDKRFVCPVCARAFTQKCTLKGHMKVHDRKIDLDETVILTFKPS